jgi:hypothetical protein
MTAPNVLEKFVEGGGFFPRHFWWAMNIGINPWSVARKGPGSYREVKRIGADGLLRSLQPRLR